MNGRGHGGEHGSVIMTGVITEQLLLAIVVHITGPSYLSVTRIAPVDAIEDASVVCKYLMAPHGI